MLRRDKLCHELRCLAGGDLSRATSGEFRGGVRDSSSCFLLLRRLLDASRVTTLIMSSSLSSSLHESDLDSDLEVPTGL